MSGAAGGYAETFPARMDAFPRVAALVERVAAEAGLARDDALRLTLVLEELFTNTVTYGHGGDCEAPIHIALAARSGGVAVLYEDTAPPFDPLTAETPARDVGGLGLRLIRSLSRDLAYERVAGRNRITLVVDARGPGG